MKISVEVKEQSAKLVKKFRKLNSRAKGDADKALAKLGRNIAKDAKANVGGKVGTGLLRRSISFRLRKKSKSVSKVEVGASEDVFYGRFLEYGTGKRGASSGYQPVAGMMGNVHKYGGGKKKGATWKGQKSRPWLSKALKKNTSAGIEDIKNEIIAGIKDEGLK